MLAIELYLKATGDNLFLKTSLDQIGPASDPAKFISALWAGLQTKHPDITSEFLKKNIRFHESGAILQSMFEVLANDFPEKRPSLLAAPSDPANPLEPETAPAPTDGRPEKN